MKRTWIKLYVEMLDDTKIGVLPAWLKWRFVELLLVAAEGDGAGILPPVTRLAWRLRVTEDDLVKSLRSLSEIGVVCEQGGCWKVANFEKRQAALTVTERVNAYRERKKDVTKSYKDANEEEVTSSSSSPSVSLEGGGVGEGETQIPESPAEAAKHPDIRLFEEVSDQFPGSADYAGVILAMQKLRAKHNGGLKDYLAPFWDAWKNGRTKDGKPYRKNNPAWLTEWAVSGVIPGESALTNGPAYKPYVPTKTPSKSGPTPEAREAMAKLKSKMTNKKVLQ